MKVNNLLIGVTASAAVLQLPKYISALSNDFDNIRLIITESASKMIEPDMLSMLVDQIYIKNDDFKKYNHIKLSEWADAFIILPATANILGKVANGIADDFLTTTIIAYGKDTVFCPNMNKSMWLNPVVQINVKKLKNLNFNFIGPIKHDAFVMADKKIGEEYIIPNIPQFYSELRSIILGSNISNEKK